MRSSWCFSSIGSAVNNTLKKKNKERQSDSQYENEESARHIHQRERLYMNSSFLVVFHFALVNIRLWCIEKMSFIIYNAGNHNYNYTM